MAHRLGRDLDADPVDAGQLTLECLRYMYRMLFVLFIYSGIKRGIVFTAINIGGTIGAAVLSSFVASLVALPIYALYEISIGVVRRAERKAQ